MIYLTIPIATLLILVVWACCRAAKVGDEQVERSLGLSEPGAGDVDAGQLHKREGRVA